MQRLFYLFMLASLACACEKESNLKPFPEVYSRDQIRIEPIQAYRYLDEGWEPLSIITDQPLDTLESYLTRQRIYEIREIKLMDAAMASLKLEDTEEERLLTYQAEASELRFWFPNNRDESLYFEKAEHQMNRPFVFYWRSGVPSIIHFREKNSAIDTAPSFPIGIINAHLLYDDFVKPGDTLLLASGMLSYLKIE